MEQKGIYTMISLQETPKAEEDPPEDFPMVAEEDSLEEEDPLEQEDHCQALKHHSTQENL